MKNISMVGLFVILSGCASALPKPDSASSVVYVSADNGSTLLAESVDGSTVNDGRYFTVTPGRHTLEVLVISERNEESAISNFVTVDIDDLRPEKSYRLVLKDDAINRELTLLDDEGVVLKETHI